MGGQGSRAVSEKQALRAFERITTGRASVIGEARRFHCYHASLRKAMRKAVGAKKYDSAMAQSVAVRKRVTGRPKGYSRQAIIPQTKVAPSSVVLAETPSFCGCVAPMRAGTDGNGIALVWCAECGHTETVRQRRPIDKQKRRGKKR